jgi:hypothetical protein
MWDKLSEYVPSLNLHWPTKGESMFQYLIDFLGSAYIEVIIFFLLVGYFVAHRRNQRLAVSGIKLLRVIGLLVVFLYFIWSWATLIPPSLRAAAVIGMFLINFYLFYSLLLSRIEQPYRAALAAMGQDPEQPGVFDNIWSTGKRFYYFYYVFEALLSGSNPFHFLKDIVNDRVQDDIKDTLRRMGVEKKLITLKLMMGFMKDRLGKDETLPEDFKVIMEKTIEELDKHPWVEEQVNEFLTIATEAPEDLHFPEWMASFKKTIAKKA